MQPFKQRVRSCGASKGRHCRCLCTDVRVLLEPSCALALPSQPINTHAHRHLPPASALHQLRADRIKCLFPLSPASTISVIPGVPWMCSQAYFNKVFSVWVLENLYQQFYYSIFITKDILFHNNILYSF